jgi:hypothetical protein
MNLYANDVVDWVIAESPEEAKSIYLAFFGNDCPEDVEFELVPNYKILRMDMDGTKITQSAGEFVTQFGKGFLGSTEY